MGNPAMDSTLQGCPKPSLKDLGIHALALFTLMQVAETPGNKFHLMIEGDDTVNPTGAIVTGS